MFRSLNLRGLCRDVVLVVVLKSGEVCVGEVVWVPCLVFLEE